jgi:autotransporter family porin
MAQIILDSNNNLIQGDFDNATLNNRTKLQTTTTNATTNVYVVPNGSSTSAGVSVANNSSLTNASKIVMATNGTTDTQIISGVNGSGTYLPMSFYTNNALGMQLSTAGNLTVTGTVTATGGVVGAGGMTLLGTLTTTSGTTQTLSGLTLTGYKQVQIVGSGVSTTFVGGQAGGVLLGPNNNRLTNDGAVGADTIDFIAFVDLTTGIYTSSYSVSNLTVNPSIYVRTSGLSTASTSIVLSLTNSTSFDAGTVRIYGVA